MESHKDRTICVVDNGLFLEIAITLSKHFGRVLYYAAWTNGYPKSNALRIGQGIKGIERVASPWPYFDEIDLWVFPDVYEGELQEHLVKMGKRVWGCRMGEELELDRVASKEHCKSIGIDIGPYEVITGLDPLREFLKKHDDQWVKISATRGDMETFHAKTYELAEPRLDELEHNLGAKKKIMEFIVEQGINPAIETGYDGYCIDGRYPKGAMTGVEIKDEAYVLKTTRYADLPEPVRKVNDLLKPTLKDYGYRGFISTEVRCTEDGGAYLIDPTTRAGSPPSELYQMMISNLADIIWYGADGILIEPEFKSKWGAELLLISEWADQNWQHISFPEAIRENVKLRNMTMIEGEYYVIPQWTGSPEIGAVVAMGDTADEAIEECKRLAEMVDGHSLDKPIDALDMAKEQLDKILGPDKPKSKAEQRAEALKAKGKISDKQYDKMMASERSDGRRNSV
jgi:hypothetical protein